MYFEERNHKEAGHNFSSSPGLILHPLAKAGEVAAARLNPALNLTHTPEYLRTAEPFGTAPQLESLFEHFAWLYILCREKLFRDDTERMIRALWSQRNPPSGTRLIEFGCGPGFYSCQFAAHFPQMSVLGVDSSENQLSWARAKTRALGLSNCSFERMNVLSPSCAAESFDALIASRLFTVLPERERVIGEMFRILRPGGRCFVAEPRGPFRASIPLFSMWVLAGLTHFRNGYREPAKATVLAFDAFEALFATQDWKSVRTWQDGRYQYALCEKG